ncbi:uncharacterized protein LOC134526476 [Chroicocephalus ridibundus]|uniref:uncharacterized protein LOC134526476 n=1 Tax=Chroicocephalus ridibundus TaxID=1192867 RepID=UPI002FDE84A1
MLRAPAREPGDVVRNHLLLLPRKKQRRRWQEIFSFCSLKVFGRLLSGLAAPGAAQPLAGPKLSRLWQQPGVAEPQLLPFLIFFFFNQNPRIPTKKKKSHNPRALGARRPPPPCVSPAIGRSGRKGRGALIGAHTFPALLAAGTPRGLRRKHILLEQAAGVELRITGSAGTTEPPAPPNNPIFCIKPRPVNAGLGLIPEQATSNEYETKSNFFPPLRSAPPAVYQLFASRLTLPHFFTHKTAGKAEGTGSGPPGTIRQRPPCRHCPPQPPPTGWDPPAIAASIAGRDTGAFTQLLSRKIHLPALHKPWLLKVIGCRLANEVTGWGGGLIGSSWRCWACLELLWILLLLPQTGFALRGFFFVEISSKLLLLVGGKEKRRTTPFLETLGLGSGRRDGSGGVCQGCPIAGAALGGGPRRQGTRSSGGDGPLPLGWGRLCPHRHPVAVLLPSSLVPNALRERGFSAGRCSGQGTGCHRATSPEMWQGTGAPRRTGVSARRVERLPGATANAAGWDRRWVQSPMAPCPQHGPVTHTSPPIPACRRGSRTASPTSPAPSPRALFVYQHVTRPLVTGGTF